MTRLFLSLTTSSSLPSDFFCNRSFPNTPIPNFNSHLYPPSSQFHPIGIGNHGPFFRQRRTWHCGNTRTNEANEGQRYEVEKGLGMFGSNEEGRTQIPTQAQSVVEGSGAVLVSEFKPVPDVDYLQELLAIQQQGPRAIGFFGTRNMGFMHQELIEILSYAMVITKNHIYTSGASGTNAAVIRGALRAEKPELLTVILPQSLKKQPPESQELLAKVQSLSIASEKLLGSREF